jgi:hypothetical protein
MTTKTIKASDVEACPIRSLSAGHYIRQDDGSILCMCAIDSITAGLPPTRPRDTDTSFAVMHREAPPEEVRVDAGDGIDPDAPRCAYRCTFCFDTAHGCTYEATTTREHDDGIDVDCCSMHSGRGGQLHDAALLAFIIERRDQCTCYRWQDTPNPLCRVHGHEDVVSGAYDANPALRRRIDLQVALIEEGN